MDVVELVPITQNGKLVNVSCSEIEVKMLLTFALNELINRGSISLLSPDDREKLERLEGLLEAEPQGSA